MVKSVEYDLRYARAGLEVLEEYLLSGDIFWPLGINPPLGEPSYPHLTLDWLLLARARLSGREMTGEEEAKVQRILSELDRYKTKWRVAWEKKARQCFHARTRMWSEYLNEYRDNPQEHADRYTYEVRIRAMLELLKDEDQIKNDAEMQLLVGLDGFVRSVIMPGDFVWETEVQDGFPKSEYWFLYGCLPDTNGKG